MKRAAVLLSLFLALPEVIMAAGTTRMIVVTRRPATEALARMRGDDFDPAARADRYKLKTFKIINGFAADLDESEIATLGEHWEAYDFFFVHYKDTDKAGEDGDFDAKVAALERFDAHVPTVRALGPDVLVVSGDHATPSILAGHGWQPVPALLWSRYCGADPVTAFSERACAAGTLGTIPAHHLMPLVMANAQRLTKFGA